MIQGFKAYLCPRSLRVQPLHPGTLGRAEQSFPASHIYWLCHAHQTTCCSHMECNVLQSLWVWGGQNQPGAFPALLCIDCASIHHLYLQEKQSKVCHNITTVAMRTSAFLEAVQSTNQQTLNAQQLKCSTIKVRKKLITTNDKLLRDHNDILK